MGAALSLLFLFALALIVGPIALNVTGHGVAPLTSAIMLASGIAIAILCVVVWTITRLYVKTKASEAFVRTGLGGLKVIRDGGALVLPVVHQVVRVSLETIRLDVTRQGADALITSDKLRADIKAEFFVRVQPEDDAIKAAARSLGDKMTVEAPNHGGSSQSFVAQIIEDKLVSALRTAAARKSLEQLNSERNEFLKEVVELVTQDLTHNGFTLETVTISKLDQTDVGNLKADNIFDAQGMRTIAEITQKNLTEKNAIVRRGEQERTAQDVETRKRVLDLERTRAEAEASQTSQIAVIQAEQTRTSREKQISAEQAVEIARVEQSRAVEVAVRQQQAAIETAERTKQQAITEAEQKLEVARRQQLKAVADAEALKAAAEAKLAEAEAERQRARQGILTVEQVATSDREKQKAIISAQAEAERNYVTAQKAADGDAYKLRTQAEARKVSAEADADATRRKAEAEAQARKLAAEAEQATLVAHANGQKAQAMVPIEVKAREVEIDKQRVEEVLKPELQARAEYGEAAQNFELAKIRIAQEATVRVEAAKAMATVYGKITANVYGTPEDVAKMGQRFAEGMGLSQMLSGFFGGADSSPTPTVRKAVEVLETLGAAAVDHFDKKDESKDHG
jgi:flotillin